MLMGDHSASDSVLYFPTEITPELPSFTAPDVVALRQASVLQDLHGWDVPYCVRQILVWRELLIKYDPRVKLHLWLGVPTGQWDSWSEVKRWDAFTAHCNELDTRVGVVFSRLDEA